MHDFIHLQRKLQAIVFLGGQIKKLWIWEILLMVQKSGFHQLRLVIYPMIYEVLHIPYTSLLVQDFFQQQYDLMQWFGQPEIQ